VVGFGRECRIGDGIEYARRVTAVGRHDRLRAANDQMLAAFDRPSKGGGRMGGASDHPRMGGASSAADAVPAVLTGDRVIACHRPASEQCGRVSERHARRGVAAAGRGAHVEREVIELNGLGVNGCFEGHGGLSW
jgi:hypothetical protein